MEWSRSETLALAMHQCTHCHGSGLRLGRKEVLSPCNCVLRMIFRVCYRRFIACATQERSLSRIGLEPQMGRQRPMTWGRKDEEYIADFCLVSRRTSRRIRIPPVPLSLPAGGGLEAVLPQIGSRSGQFLPCSLSDRAKTRPHIPRAGAVFAVSRWTSISRALHGCRQPGQPRPSLGVPARCRNACAFQRLRKSLSLAEIRRIAASNPRIPLRRRPRSLRRDD